MIKVYIALFIISILGAVGYGAFYYYKDTQSRIATLTENSAKLEVAAQTQKQTIDTLQADAKKYAKLNNELQTKLEKANDYKNTLLGKLRKHNLTKLSAQKPTLIEKRINNASKKLLESFESLTAVPSNK